MALPLLALLGVVALFLRTGANPFGPPPVPVESLAVEATRLAPGRIELHVRNTGPGNLTLTQLVVNDAVWPFSAHPGPAIPRLGRAMLEIRYPWVEGEAYRLRLFTANGVPFDHEIAAAVATPELDGPTLWTFTLIGLYVGVLPVFLGMLWFPALRLLGARALTFVLAFTVGLLLALAVDTLAEALEAAGRVPGPFQGLTLAAAGLVVTFGALDAITRRQMATGRSAADLRLLLAYRIAAGIGVHNLGEGLAIGAAYRSGEAALGTFLVVGFIVQNLTEGLGIVAPLLRDRPRLGHLAAMGLLGGLPAVAGAWVGVWAASPLWGTLFLGIGAGAVLEVAWEVLRLQGPRLQRDPRAAPVVNIVGIALGMLTLYGLGILVK